MITEKLDNPLKKEFKLKEVETKKEIKSETLCNEVSEVVTCLMNASISLHKLHLKVTGIGSYAAHSALSGYDKFHDFADDLAEGFAGAYGELLKYTEEIPKTLNSAKEAISFLDYVKEEVTDLQSKLPYSEIINQLDIVKEHCNGMKYKLLFLQ